MTSDPVSSFSPGKRIFLSYGRDDFVIFAKRLKDDLGKAGYEVWFDADRIKPGEDWEHYIEDGLAWVSENVNGGCFILLMTPHSVRRPDGFCLNELARAIQLNLKVIPVMLAWCEPPLSICRIQWLDMMDCISGDSSGEKYLEKLNVLQEVIEHDRQEFEGSHARLINILKPLSFDAEIKYNLEQFIGRSWVMEAIESWLQDESAQRIFWITGSPGVGKTSISAWLCAHWREVAAFHFCRHENAQKTDSRRCIMSLAYQLSTQLPEYEQRLNRMSLADIENLNARALFDTLIVQPLSRDFPSPGPAVIMVIDALDEATIDGRNDLAGFIASEFERTPNWLRMIITSRPDPEVVGPLQAFTQFPIEVGDARNEQDIYNFLAKELGEGIPVEVVQEVAARCNGLFIYAEWVQKELKYGRLSLDHIDDFPRGLGGIYLRFFERQFPDIKAWEARVRPVLEVMSAVQEPISLRIIAAIFKWNIHEERELKLSLGSLFISYSGMIQPFHISVMEWLTDEEKDDRYFVSVVEGHRILGKYLLDLYHKGRPAWGHQLLKYLPLHLCLSERLEELESVLRDMEYISYEWSRDRFGVMKWWAIIEERTDIRMIAVFKDMIDTPSRYDEKYLGIVASMFSSSFQLAESCRLYEYLVRLYRGSGKADELRDALSQQASVLVDMSDYEQAIPILEELEQMCREAKDMERLQRSLLARAEYLLKCNEFDKSLSLLLEQERICRDMGNFEGLWTSLNEQSTIQRVKGNISRAISLLLEQERICRDIGNIDGLKESLLNQGLIKRAIGDFDNAIKLFNEVETLSRKTNDRENIIVSMSLLAIIYGMRGGTDEALEILKRAENQYREINFSWGLWDNLYTQSILLRQKGDLHAAQHIIEEALRICRGIDNLFGVQTCLGQQAIILRLNWDLDASLALHKEEERICREIGHKRDLAMSLSNQAIILRLKGDPDGALALHNEAESMLREIGYKYGLQECLGEKAMTLYKKGDLNAALVLLREQEKYCKDMGLKPDLMRCLENLRTVLHGLEDLKVKEKCLVSSKNEFSPT